MKKRLKRAWRKKARSSSKRARRFTHPHEKAPIYLQPFLKVAKRKKTYFITCAYCRSQIRQCDSQRDHIPPKSLFTIPRPSNLVTVRCCETCHKDLSDGDEALRSFAALSWGTTNSARGLKAVTDRAHIRAPWWLAELKECARQSSPILNPYDPSEELREIRMTGGIAEAIHRTLVRTVRVLLFDHNPEFDTRTTKFELFQSKPINLEQFADVAHGLGPLRFRQIFGEGAFGAIWDFTAEDPHIGVMIMSFFGRLNFTVFFGPPGRFPDHPPAP